MGTRITEKVSEFTFDTGVSLKGPVTISADQLKNERCRYTIGEKGKEECTFLGKVIEVWEHGASQGQIAILRSLDGIEKSLPARLYVVASEQEKPTDKLGAYLLTVSRIE